MDRRGQNFFGAALKFFHPVTFELGSAHHEVFVGLALELFVELFFSFCLSQSRDFGELIATLCDRLAGQGCELVVVSSDKDLMQLVTNGTKLLDSAKDRWIGKDEVREKFGVSPEQVIEVMGLMGDAVDNIPGVKGIGEKTAGALIQQFGTLENLYDHLDEVKTMKLRGAARVRDLLEEKRDIAFLSRALATVKRDVPLDTGLPELQFTGFNLEKTRTLFTELEFTNLIKLIENGG